MKVERIGPMCVWIGCIYFLLVNFVYAEKPSDEDALQGLTEGKVVWDVTVSSPARLLFLMQVIEETYDDLVRQNIKPDMYLRFMGVC